LLQRVALQIGFDRAYVHGWVGGWRVSGSLCLQVAWKNPATEEWKLAALNGLYGEETFWASRLLQCLSPRHAKGLARLRRRIMREFHSRHSKCVMTGMLGLLHLCGRVSGVAFGVLADSLDAPVKWQLPRATLLSIGARPISCAEAPSLYGILARICVRAGLSTVPELFLMPMPGMNAYALGSPEDACISVTEGLLRGLSPDEVAGIFAHEVAHIREQDPGAMNWATSMQDDITMASLLGLVELAKGGRTRGSEGRQAVLLAFAPVVARLLYSALSRVRELVADSMAIDMIDDPNALASALCKLEFAHSGLTPLDAHLLARLHQSSLTSSMNSHPGTWERLSHM
jgi:heat shock protein HtpX